MSEIVADTRLDALLLHAEVEALLHREAALLDARDFSGWLELFAPDALYWIPSSIDDADPSQQVSLAYDDHARLRERVWRLESGLAYAQEPTSRTSHLVGNVETSVAGEDVITATSAFVVSEFRREQHRSYAGRYRHELRRTSGGLSIVVKKVELIANDGHLGNLSLVL